MASREIHIGDMIHAIEQSHENHNRKLVKLLDDNFHEDDKIRFHFCDDEGLIDFLDLGEQSKDSLMDEYGLIDKAEVAILLSDHNTQDGKRKIELVQKMMELELWEIELLLKPLNEKFNLGLSESYYYDIEHNQIVKDIF